MSKRIGSAHHQRACHALDTITPLFLIRLETVIIRVLITFGDNLVSFFLPTWSMDIPLSKECDVKRKNNTNQPEEPW
jgi:hypothetical protein